MKQKYVIMKEDDKLIIQEFAELDKGLMSLICEQSFDADVIEKVAEEGPAAVAVSIVSKNMYPPSVYLDKLAETIIHFFKSAGQESADVYFDDVKMLIKNREAIEAEAKDDDSTDIDDLLDDDDDSRDDNFDDDGPIAVKSNSSIKIADDDSLDTDDA